MKAMKTQIKSYPIMWQQVWMSLYVLLAGIFLAILVSMPSVAEQRHDDGKTMLLGVVPQQSAKVLAKNWTPLVQYLSKETGIKIKFATAKDIPTFEQRLSGRVYQLAYMNPYHFVHYHQTAGYQALVKQQGKQIKGIIVTQKNVPLSTLTELNGERIAFPAPAAFAASILTRSALEQQGVAFAPHYVSSHDSVYLNVSKGLFVAGGGVLRTFQLAPKQVKDKLQVFHTTKGYTPHALAISDDVSPVLKSKLQTAFIKLSQDDQGQNILKGVNIKAFEAAENSDWDDVRKLNLSELLASN